MLRFLVSLLIIVAFSFALINHFASDISYVTVHEAKIACTTRGMGEPIILLEGFGMTIQQWDPLLLDKLAVHNRVIIFDSRGVGRSTGNIDQLSQTQMAEDVIGLMDKLHIRKAHILGWSSGSFIAQVIAEHHPDRVNSLILIATAPAGDQKIDPSTEINTAIQNKLGGSWEEVYVPFMFYSKEAKKAYLSRIHAAQLKKPVLEETIDAKLAQERAFADKTQDKQRNQLLSSINSPTLLITGKNDILLVPENAKRVAAHIPHAHLVIIPQAGHAVLFEKPDEVVGLITEFVHKN